MTKILPDVMLLIAFVDTMLYPLISAVIHAVATCESWSVALEHDDQSPVLQIPVVN